MAEEKSIRLEKWQGKNDMNRAWEMPMEFLTTASNVDVTRAGTVRTRQGFTATSLGTGFKNLWSNDFIILATQESDLVRIKPDLSGVSILRTQVGNYNMAYCTVNDTVVYTNGQVIGYIKNYTNYSFTTPTDNFKRPMMPGQLIEFFRNRIYVAQSNILWFSDVVSTSWGTIDALTGARQLASRIRLLKSVDDGIYLSDDNYIYFATGNSPEKMTLDRVTFFPAIEGMVREIDGSLLPEPVAGRCLAICCTDGLHIATNGGQIKNVTDKVYSMGSGVSGTILFRRNNIGMNQLILSIRR